jgi:Cas3 C-terminal domain
VKALRDTDLPAGFADHPWLRHVKVLTLIDGACTLGNTRITLDPELGVIYEAPASTGSAK